MRDITVIFLFRSIFILSLNVIIKKSYLLMPEHHFI